MPNRCVAIGCGNMPSDSVSLFRFPEDPNLCGFRTRQVQPHAGALEVTTYSEWKPTSTISDVDNDNTCA